MEAGTEELRFVMGADNDGYFPRHACAIVGLALSEADRWTTRGIPTCMNLKIRGRLDNRITAAQCGSKIRGEPISEV